MTTCCLRRSSRFSSLLVSFSSWSKYAEVPLVAVPAPGAEQPHAEVGVAEQEPAEVAVERLDAGAHRDEVEVGADVEQLDLAERLLQREVLAPPRAAFLRRDVEDVALAHVDVVEVELRRDAERPVARLERGVALEQLEREDRARQHRVLLALAEELLRSGLLGADARTASARAVLERRLRDRR